MSKPQIGYGASENLIKKLNERLTEAAALFKWGDYKRACRELGIPTSSHKCTTKQLSGYIGAVSEKILNEKKRLKNEASFIRKE